MASKFFGFFKRHYILTGFLAFIIVVVGWWKYEYPSATWRYKLTILVETPDGIKTGAAVREVYASEQPGFMGVSARTHYSVKGEAVVVDLGDGKYLFSIMDIDGSYLLVDKAFPFSEAHNIDHIRYYASLTGKRDMPLNSTAFVTFKDINNQMTVKSVNPFNLEKSFGVGVKLKDVVIEMTDEPLTWEIDKYLPWLSDLHGNYLGGGFASSNAPMGLHGGFFQRKGNE